MRPVRFLLGASDDGGGGGTTVRGTGASTEEVLARLETRGTSSTFSSSSFSSSARKVSVSLRNALALGLGEAVVEVEVGMVHVWALVVGGVGTDRGLV